MRTQVLLEAAVPHRVPVLLASTSEVYGKSRQPSQSEDDDPADRPAAPGALELRVLQAHGRVSRAGVREGAGASCDHRAAFQHGRSPPDGPVWDGVAALHRIRQGGPAAPRLRQRLPDRCFCFVRDTVEALLRLQACPAAYGQVFNVGSTEEVSIRQLARLVIRSVGSRSSIEFVPYQEAYGADFGDMRRRKPLVEKLKRVTGFSAGHVFARYHPAHSRLRSWANVWGRLPGVGPVGGWPFGRISDVSNTPPPVAQVFNLPYRRFLIGMPSDDRTRSKQSRHFGS